MKEQIFESSAPSFLFLLFRFYSIILKNALRVKSMKRFKKILSILSLSIFFLASVTGCANNRMVDWLTQEAVDAYVEKKKEEVDLNAINFSEEIKKMTLFGKTLSIPCKLRDLGDEFGYLQGSETTAPGYDWVMAGLTYEGKWIGMVTLSDYTEGADLNELYIEGVLFGFDDEDTSLSPSEKKELYESSGKYGDKIDFSFAGLTFDSTQEEIIQRLGKPHQESETQWDYNYGEGYLQFSFHNKKVVEIDVEMY